MQINKEATQWRHGHAVIASGMLQHSAAATCRGFVEAALRKGIQQRVWAAPAICKDEHQA